MPFDQERYERLRMQLVDRNEANVGNIYLDVLGIPTVGLGVALTARQADRTMALDENHVDALGDVLNLNSQQRQQLTGLLQDQLAVQNQHIDERHNSLPAFLASDFGQDSQRVLGPMVNTQHTSPSGASWSWDVLTSAESPMQIQLTHQQSLHLFDRVAPEYEGRLNNVLRRGGCPAEALSEEQRAAIYSMVYQGATDKAQRTADALGDYWRGELTEDQLRTRLRTVVNDPAFPERSRNELEFLENIKHRPPRQTEVQDRENPQAFTTGDPDLDKLAAAMFANDEAAISCVSAQIEQSPQMQSFEQWGRDLVAAQQREELQKQEMARQMQGPVMRM
ncbi:hypothetical protein [Xanthomonas sp. GPE 39]|uniref:hypothetical protein n=1 Tax=Xanthomonas sp. GPE 39 TaxID=1583099 RepID=UPI000AD7D3B0|nr:hypothetical protein [Xanthomonas sp. GPE 39]